MWLYHATSYNSALWICSNGFRPGNGGLLGPAVYGSEDPYEAIRRARGPNDTIVSFWINISPNAIPECNPNYDCSWDGYQVVKVAYQDSFAIFNTNAIDYYSISIEG